MAFKGSGSRNALGGADNLARRRFAIAVGVEGGGLQIHNERGGYHQRGCEQMCLTGVLLGRFQWMLKLADREVIPEIRSPTLGDELTRGSVLNVLSLVLPAGDVV